MKVTLSDKQRSLIEKNGVLLERSGMPPAQARILSLLLICDQTELTFEAIYETLKISKSAASNAINILLQKERIEYHTKPGDRRRYFAYPLDTLEDSYHKAMIKMLEVNKVLVEILENRTPKTVEFNNKLERLIQFMVFFQKELPVLYEKWKKQHCNQAQ